MSQKFKTESLPQIIDVTSANIDKCGFFCFMSKKKSESYQRKLNWLKARFSEGMRIKLLTLPERGFIEYIPGALQNRTRRFPPYGSSAKMVSASSDPYFHYNSWFW